MQLRPTTTAAALQPLFYSLDATIVGEIPQLGVVALSVPTVGTDYALSVLDRDPSIAYAEPDARARAAVWPNDPGWTQQWGPQKINAPLAWDRTLGSPGVIIAVIDSGVTLDHPDLADQLWVNPGEVAANGQDDEGNGKVDDVWGWRFYHRWDGQIYLPMEDNSVADDFGHGTQVAGIAGAEIDNGLGIAGMAPGSRLMTVKVLDQYGIGWYFDIAQGIVYAVDNGAQIINLSLGGTFPSATLQAAVDYAQAKGAVVVAASGNSGESVLYPAACQHALAVAATNKDDEHPTFSNQGPEVDVAAPGVEIYATWPWRDGYWSQSGTSLATPHVAGLAALIRSMQPTLTPIQVSHVITSTAIDLQPPGRDPFSGWGRIDADAALVRLGQHGLELNKEVSPGRLGPGAPLTYTIAFGQNDQVMTGIIVSDSLPAGVEFVSASAGGTYLADSHEVVWGPLALTEGAWITATVVATIGADVPACAAISNTVQLFYDPDEQPLSAGALHRHLPCYAHLPIMTRAR